MKPILVTSGEPAGVGPDICLSLAQYNYPIVVMASLELLKERAQSLNINVHFHVYHADEPLICDVGHLSVMPITLPTKVIAGQLNVNHAAYVIDMLSKATDACLDRQFSALVTAPVHKGIINDAGIPFTGHTEFLATRCHAEVVMMLVSDTMRVALVTTHLPLARIAETITEALLARVIQTVHQSLQDDFAIMAPILYISGLNPHAGEGGHLGREEIDVISPVIKRLKTHALNVIGPLSADTMFCHDASTKPDAYVVMYHDQGLPVIKYASFGEAVNVTLGLPIIRTSVDHGTALELAGTGKAHSRSLVEAVKLACHMAKSRYSYDNH